MPRQTLGLALLAILFYGPLTPTSLLAAESRPLYALAISPDGKLAATGGEDGVILIRELGTGRKLLE